MGLAALAIIVMAIGTALRFAGPNLGPKAGMARLLS